MKTANLYHELEYNENKPLIKVLFETSFTKEIRIAMHRDTQMKAHKTPFPIVVEIIEGSIDFGVLGELKQLYKGDLIALDGGILHDLKATENSIVRLTLTKNDEAKRVISVVDNE